MPLSEHEQRQLEQIEQALYAEHPRFARAVRASDPKVHYRRRLIQAAVGFLMGVGLLVAGVVIKNPWIVAGGVVVMLACSMWSLSSYRHMAGITSGRGPAGGRTGGRAVAGLAAGRPPGRLPGRAGPPRRHDGATRRALAPPPGARRQVVRRIAAARPLASRVQRRVVRGSGMPRGGVFPPRKLVSPDTAGASLRLAGARFARRQLGCGRGGAAGACAADLVGAAGADSGVSAGGGSAGRRRPSSRRRRGPGAARSAPGPGPRPAQPGPPAPPRRSRCGRCHGGPAASQPAATRPARAPGRTGPVPRRRRCRATASRSGSSRPAAVTTRRASARGDSLAAPSSP